MKSLAPFIEFAQQLADEAAAMIAAQQGRALETSTKTDKTFVTQLDLAIELKLRGMIRTVYPDHGILGEEFEPHAIDAPYVWSLDPIDGTMALVTGMPVYSTLIALLHHGQPVVGVMHFPATQERWVGAMGQPTLRNGQVCHTRVSTSEQDLLSTAVHSASSPDFFKHPDERRALAALTEQTAWRIYGGAAMSYGRLASGTIDVSIDAGLKLYDYAAFVPIVQGAGGVITDWAGQPLTLHSGSQVLAAGDPRRHAAALRIIQAQLNQDAS
jgi:inositol-phosphate phosphatase / L-galactose 1-phosphate phosphatase / histidinol-phosphatase